MSEINMFNYFTPVLVIITTNNVGNWEEQINKMFRNFNVIK